MLLRALCDRFDLFNRQNKKPKTAEYYRWQLQKVKLLWGDMEAADLKPAMMLELRCTWHLCAAVKRLYHWAFKEARLIETDPMADMVKPRRNKRKRTLDRGQTNVFLRGAKADFRRFMLAVRETAARPQEVRELDWLHLKWKGGYRQLVTELNAGRAYFELLEYKGRERRSNPDEPRIIPISPRLGRLLARLSRGRALNGLIFTTDKGAAWTRNSLRCRMRRLRDRVAVPHVLHGEKIVCYTLRHSKATELAGDGMQTSVLQLLLGHANINTTQRYVHLGKQQLLAEWQRHLDGRDGKHN